MSETKYGYKVTAIVTSVKGKCTAGLQQGAGFELSCQNPAGLCGFFYNSISPDLQTFQFGGCLPWWKGNVIEVQCPDPENRVTLRLERSDWMQDSD